MTVDHPRRIRSFVRRPGRMTTGQRRALAELLPRWGIEYVERQIDLDAAFGRHAPRVLDIGFGDGEALLTTASRYPEIDYLGVEVHAPGIGHLLTLVERARLTNVRVIERDAVDVIAHMLPAASLAAVNLFFPDPWPKKRHHKRRLVSDEFLGRLAPAVGHAGLLHIATDWAPYAEWIADTLERSPWFTRVTADEVADPRLAFRPPTKFEGRGRRLGHEVTDFFSLRRHAADNRAD